LVAFEGSGLGAEKDFSPETAMSKHITLTVDYHDRACVIRWFDHSVGQDQLFTEVPTTKGVLNAMVEKARLEQAGRELLPGSRRAPPAGPASRHWSPTAHFSGPRRYCGRRDVVR
jgi:hypothetical protein